MAIPTWKVSVDLNRDTDLTDAGEDISGCVMQMEWQLGWDGTTIGEPLAPAELAVLTVRNDDGAFSPDSASALANLDRGRIIKIESTYDATTRDHFQSWVKTIEPTAGSFQRRQAVIETEAWAERAQRAEAFVPIQESKTADQVIEAIFERTNIYPPAVGLKRLWFIGVAGFSEIGTSTYLATGTSDYASLEVGRTTFNYMGDKWGDGVSVYRGMQDTIGREFGLGYIDRSGVFQFKNRHYYTLKTTSSASFDDTMAGVEYDYGTELWNKVLVTARPRLVSGSGVTLGTLDRAFTIPRSGSKEISYRYRDSANNVKIAGKDAITPAAGTDFTATPANVSASIVEETATRTKVRFSNTGGVDATVATGSKIRGTKITDYGQIDIEREDDTSLGTFGYNLFTYPFDADTVSDAEGFADYLLDLGKDARGHVRSITLKPIGNASLLEQALARTIGDRISIKENQLGIDSDHFIVGERFRVDLAGKDLEVRWYLMPATQFKYWVLGTTGLGELGTATTLGPL